MMIKRILLLITLILQFSFLHAGIVILNELPTKKWTNFLSPYAAILNLLIIS
jgi:hypothetical protein